MQQSVRLREVKADHVLVILQDVLHHASHKTHRHLKFPEALPVNCLIWTVSSTFVSIIFAGNVVYKPEGQKSPEHAGGGVLGDLLKKSV